MSSNSIGYIDVTFETASELMDKIRRYLDMRNAEIDCETLNKTISSLKKSDRSVIKAIFRGTVFYNPKAKAKLLTKECKKSYWGFPCDVSTGEFKKIETLLKMADMDSQKSIMLSHEAVALMLRFDKISDRYLNSVEKLNEFKHNKEFIENCIEKDKCIEKYRQL